MKGSLSFSLSLSLSPVVCIERKFANKSCIVTKRISAEGQGRTIIGQGVQLKEGEHHYRTGNTIEREGCTIIYRIGGTIEREGAPL